MLLIMIDAHLKWIKVHVMSSSTVIATIVNLCVTFAQMGIPKTVVTDNGPCFISVEFEEFVTMNSIMHGDI